MALTWAGGPWVVDTSAWARAAAAEVSPRWKEAAAKDELVGCPVVTLEMLYGAQDRDQVEALAGALAGMRQAPITRAVTDAAIGAMRDLAAGGSAGAHRVRVPDALVAAAAAERGYGVLHYDEDYDTLATVLTFESQWVAPRGSVP